MNINACLHWDPFTDSKIVKELLLASNDSDCGEESVNVGDGIQDIPNFSGWPKKTNLNSVQLSTTAFNKALSKISSNHRNLKSQKTNLFLSRTSWKEPHRGSLDARQKIELLFPWRGVFESNSYRYIPHNSVYQRWKMKMNFPTLSIQTSSFFTNISLTGEDILMSTRSITTARKELIASHNELEDNRLRNLTKSLECVTEKTDMESPFTSKTSTRHDSLVLPQLPYGRSMTSILERQIHFDGVIFNRQSTILRVAKRNEALNSRMKLAPIHDNSAVTDPNKILFSTTSVSHSENVNEVNEQVQADAKKNLDTSLTKESCFTDRSAKYQAIPLKPLFHCCSETCMCRNHGNTLNCKDRNYAYSPAEMSTGFGEDNVVARNNYSSYIYKAFHSNSLGQKRERRLFANLNPNDSLSIQKCSVMLSGVGLK